jgi:hypothetical protein
MADHVLSKDVSMQVCFANFDEIWPSLSKGDPKIHGIKIDVQGAEYDVLMGMRQFLGTHVPTLVIEFHAGVDRSGLTKLLESLGYGVDGQAVGRMPAGPPYIDNHSYTFWARTGEPTAAR